MLSRYSDRLLGSGESAVQVDEEHRDERSLPLVSVVIPTYNRPRLLAQAAQSVFAQTYRNLELIVVDDGSTDDTPAFLSEFTDPRLEVIHRTHTGNRAAVRNTGIEAARGEWIAFLDSDDLWLKNKLEIQMHDLLEAPDCRWSFTGFALVDESGRPLPTPKGATTPTAVSADSLQRSLLAYVVAAPLPSLTVEKRLLVEIGGLDVELYHDDLDLVLRLSAAAPGLYCPEPLLLIRKDSARPWDVRDSLFHHQQMSAVLSKHQATASKWAVRALCRAQRARHLLLVARAQAGLGFYGRAAVSAVSSLFRVPYLLYLWAYRLSRRDTRS